MESIVAAPNDDNDNVVAPTSNSQFQDQSIPPIISESNNQIQDQTTAQAAVPEKPAAANDISFSSSDDHQKGADYDDNQSYTDQDRLKKRQSKLSRRKKQRGDSADPYNERHDDRGSQRSRSPRNRDHRSRSYDSDRKDFHQHH